MVAQESQEPHLPNNILYRPKMGFAVPLARWFRGPLRQRVRAALLEGRLAQTGYFNANYLEQLVEEHLAGRRDHSSPLWALLMFEAFLRVGETSTRPGQALAQAAPDLASVPA